MSLKGGYKIIDLKGVDVTQSTMMIEGIYESIESNYGKPLLISGIVIDGVEKDDVFVQATLNGTAYEFNVYGYTIQVQDTNAVGLVNKYMFIVRFRGRPVNSTIIEYNSSEQKISDYLVIQNAVGNYLVKKFNIEGKFDYILGTYVLGSGANIIISTKFSRSSGGNVFYNNLFFSTFKDGEFNNGGVTDSTTINVADITIELLRI